MIFIMISIAGLRSGHLEAVLALGVHGRHGVGRQRSRGRRSAARQLVGDDGREVDHTLRVAPLVVVPKRPEDGS